MPPRLSLSSVKRRKAAKVALKREDQLIATANTARFLARMGWGRSSGLSASSRQSNPLIDRTVLNILDKKLASGGRFALSESPARLVPIRTASQLKRLKRWGANYSLSRKARHAISVTTNHGSRPTCTWHVPNWDHASEVLKTMAYVTSIPRGHRLAFTLRLTATVVSRALRSPKGPAKYLQDRIASALRRSFAGQHPQFMMVLETTGDGWTVPTGLGLHIHGVLALPRDATMAIVPEIKTSLGIAGGQVDRRKAARQVHTSSCLNPIVWTSYIYKHRLSSAEAIQNAVMLGGQRPQKSDLQLICATNGLRAHARKWFNERRSSEDLEWVDRKRSYAAR